MQCIPWPVACSEWGACLTPSKFRVLGANDPGKETFHFSHHFYLLYLLLNRCDGNDMFWRHSTLVKQSSFFSRKQWNLSLQICDAKQSSWLQNLWTGAGTCIHCTNTCLWHQPLWPATWSSASLTHGQAYHKTWSTKQLVNAESDYVQAWRQMASLWTSAKLKPALFGANTLHKAALFRATNSLPRKTRCFALFPSQLFKRK